ncbi:MAG: DnaJ domain-containing protein [Terriglobia bacterium]
MTNRNGVPDYYDILQLSPRAEQLVITKVYRLLAAYYHPDNKQSGNEEKFKQVLEAYEVLSDPTKRSRYDLTYPGKGQPRSAEPSTKEARSSVTPGLDQLRAKYREQAPTSPDQDGGMSERELRKALLLALYDVRRNNPGHPYLSMLVLAELLGCRVDDLEFSNWYLKEKGYIKISESADFSITIAGVDFVENEMIRREGASPYLSLPESRL